MCVIQFVCTHRRSYEATSFEKENPLLKKEIICTISNCVFSGTDKIDIGNSSSHACRHFD